jgi:hypothetical protein
LNEAHGDDFGGFQEMLFFKWLEGDSIHVMAIYIDCIILLFYDEYSQIKIKVYSISGTMSKVLNSDIFDF